MNTILWSREARQDLSDIDAYLRENNIEPAQEMLRSSVAAARFLAGTPQAGEAISGTLLRKWRVRGSPYILLYRHGDDMLAIVRVVHAARDWRRFV